MLPFHQEQKIRNESNDIVVEILREDGRSELDYRPVGALALLVPIIYDLRTSHCLDLLLGAIGRVICRPARMRYNPKYASRQCRAGPATQRAGRATPSTVLPWRGEKQVKSGSRPAWRPGGESKGKLSVSATARTTEAQAKRVCVPAGRESRWEKSRESVTTVVKRTSERTGWSLDQL